LGVGLHPDGVSIAKVKRAKKGPPKLLECLFIATDGEAQQQQELLRISRELKLKGLPASVVLAPGSYSLLQVERPEVQDDEVRSAIRWRIKDLIDFHIDDAVLDLFDLPEGSRAGAPRLMFVVAARIAVVQRIIDLLKTAAIRSHRSILLNWHYATCSPAVVRVRSSGHYSTWHPTME